MREPRYLVGFLATFVVPGVVVCVAYLLTDSAVVGGLAAPGRRRTGRPPARQERAAARSGAAADAPPR